MLSEFLDLNIFHLFLVFSRVGAMMMIMPGLRVGYVAMRARLLLTIAVTLVMTPVLGTILPDLPDSVGILVQLISVEVFYGAFLGTIGQLVSASIHLAGTSIGQSAGLMNAMVFDPVTESQGALVIGFLTTIALISIFVMDLHHLMLQAVYQSYALFPVGQSVFVEDHVTTLVQKLAQGFFSGS